jgi:hypothetical protein
MSLIGDALRKARQEAADRDSERRGVLFSARISDTPGRSNLGLGLALGALIAVAATIAGGATVWWILDREEVPAQPAEEAERTAGVADDPDTDPVPGPQKSSDSAGERRRDQQPVAATGAGAVAATVSESESEGPDPDPDPVPDPVPEGADAGVSAGPPGQDPAQVPPGAELEAGFVGMENGEEVYILEAELGGVVLSLDFIVSRSDDPFAEINGVEVHLGGVVDGYRVKAIEKDRVRLSNGRRTVILRVP